MTDRFHPQKLQERLRQVRNAIGERHFADTPQRQARVSIRPDSGVAPATFRPDPAHPGGYLAHPQTLRALRRDIFVAGDELFADLEEIVQCIKCARQSDRQFWLFCPYCGEKFSR